MVKKVLDECASDASLASSTTLPPAWPPPDPDDALFRSATSKYFCGQARNDSPFGTYLHSQMGVLCVKLQLLIEDIPYKGYLPIKDTAWPHARPPNITEDDSTGIKWCII